MDNLYLAVSDLLQAIQDLGISIEGPHANDEMGDVGRQAERVKFLLDMEAGEES